ncbi:MAG: carboxypeptidase regulatory-like domain-containing protein, partial [Candidatus Syntrophosphaera sp.]
LNSYNLVLLDDPVPVTATEELWFGFLCDVTGVNPAYAGMDYGPAVDGFGNMIYWQGSWTTLLAVNSYCDFNWNIQGYVGLTPPDGPPALTPISLDPRTGFKNRALEGYDVWRLLQGQETNEAAWVCLTPQPVSETVLQDDSWDDIPDGNYLWAVKAVYTGDVLSEPIFSNVLANITQIGSIAGIVRDIENAPIMDATITCGDATTQTNANGAYTMQIETGTYNVTASHPDYVPVTQDSVVVLTGQTTTVNFVLDAVGIGEDEVPSYATSLLGNHPNPFNPQTTIRFSLETQAQVDMRIYNLKGELIRSLLNEIRQSGYHSIIWDGTDDAGIPVSSGVYYLRMKAGDFTKTGKMILMK